MVLSNVDSVFRKGVSGGRAVCRSRGLSVLGSYRIEVYTWMLGCTGTGRLEVAGVVSREQDCKDVFRESSVWLEAGFRIKASASILTAASTHSPT